MVCHAYHVVRNVVMAARADLVLGRVMDVALLGVTVGPLAMAVLFGTCSVATKEDVEVCLPRSSHLTAKAAWHPNDGLT
jgi:hypothetical protein